MARMLWVGVWTVIGAVLATQCALPVGVMVVVVGVSGLVALRWLSVGLTVGALGLGFVAVLAQPIGPTLRGPVAVRGVVVGGVSGAYGDVSVSQWRLVSGSFQETAGRVTVRFPNAAPPIGTAVAIFADATTPHWPSLPGAPNRSMSTALARSNTLLFARQVAYRRLVETPDDVFSEARWSGLLRALTAGDRSGVEPETIALMRRTGTAHLLAISGYHIGVVAGFVVMIVRLLFGLLSLRYRAGFSLRWSWMAGFVVASGYALQVGLPVSTQRALVGLLVFAVARLFGVRPRAETLLGSALVAVVMSDPSTIGSASFQLSFGAMLGLVRLYPRVVSYLSVDLPFYVAWPLRAGLVSLCALVGTMPAALWWFQEVSVVSVWGNFVAGPLVGGLVVPLAFMGSVWPALSGLTGWLADGLLDANFWWLRCVDAPTMLVALSAPAAVVWVMWLLWPRSMNLALFALLVSSLRTLPLLGTTLTFLPVGQGDATLIEFGDGRRWLVDGGPRSTDVVRWLRRQGIDSLDVVVATHDHPDHTAGLVAVLDEMSVGALWIPAGGGFETLTSVSLVPVVENPPLSMANEAATPSSQSENNRSLVFTLQVEGCVALLTGDIESEREIGLRVGAVDVLKVAHHGSRSSTTDAFVAQSRPLVAVAQVGKNNPFGHPHSTVTDRLQSAGAAMFRTDTDGLVRVNLRDGRIRVFTSGHKEDDEGRGRDHQGNPLRCRDSLPQS